MSYKRKGGYFYAVNSGTIVHGKVVLTTNGRAYIYVDRYIDSCNTVFSDNYQVAGFRRCANVKLPFKSEECGLYRFTYITEKEYEKIKCKRLQKVVDKVYLGETAGYEVHKDNGKAYFGCGSIVLTKQEISNIIKLASQVKKIEDSLRNMINMGGIVEALDDARALLKKL